MQYNDLINRLQNLTDKNLTDRLMMEAFGLKSPSTIVYKRQNNVYVNDDEIKKIELAKKAKIEAEKRAKAAKINKLKQNMRFRYDKVEDITFIQDKTSSWYVEITASK